MAMDGTAKGRNLRQGMLAAYGRRSLALLLVVSTLAPGVANGQMTPDVVRRGADRETRPSLEMPRRNMATPCAAVGGPAARRQTHDRYSALSDKAAAHVAAECFADAFARPPFAARRPAPGARVEEFLGSNAATVTDDLTGSRMLLRTTGPLTANSQPVDLALRAGVDGYVSRNPFVPVAFGGTYRQGLTLASLGVALRPNGKDRSPVVEAGQLFFPNVLPDTDYSARPEIYGAETFFQLRSPRSPERFVMDLDLPEGLSAARAVSDSPIPGDPPRSIAIRSGDEVVAVISAPFAFDANGAPVEADMELRGREVVISIEHRGRDVVYPIVLDPEVNEHFLCGAADGAGGWAGWGWTQGAGNYGGFGSAKCDPAYNPNGLYQSMPTHTMFANGDWAEWHWFAPPDVYIYRAIIENWVFSPYIYPPPPQSGGVSYTRSWSGLFDSARNWTTNVSWYDSSNGATVASNPAGPAAAGFGPKNVDLCYQPRCSATQGPDAGGLDVGIQACCTSNGTGIWTDQYIGIVKFNSAHIYLDDGHAPTLTSARPSDRDWRNDGGQSHTLTVSAADRGLGLYGIALSGAASGGGNANVGCGATIRFGHCPFAWTKTFTYTLNEGVSNLSLSAYDLGDNSSASQGWVEKIDRTQPDVTPSGSLWEDRNGWIAGQAAVTAHASDSVSGISRVEFQIDGAVVEAATPGCPSGCDASFTFQPDDYRSGVHTAALVVTDFAGNVRSRSWEFKSDPVAPLIDVYGALVDSDGETVSGNGYGLAVSLTDGAAASDGAPAENESGATAIDIRVDGNSVGGYPISQSCSGGNCEFSTPAEWEFRPADYAEGGHVVTVVGTDAAGNSDEEEILIAVKHPQPADSRSASSFDPALNPRLDGLNGENAGASVTAIGDLNADGFDDFAVGAPNSNFNGSRSGAVYVIYGDAITGTHSIWDTAGSGLARTAIYGGASNQYCGTVVAGIGDFTGDGYGDIAIGCPGSDGSAVLAPIQGHVWVVPGGPALPTYINLANTGSGLDIRGPVQVRPDAGAGVGHTPGFGEVLSAPMRGDFAPSSDINGDGRADLVIGDPGASNNQRLTSGSAYVIFGRSSLSPVEVANIGSGGFRIDGPPQQQYGVRAGWSVAIPGDVNGDELADVIVGAPYQGATLFEGGAYVVYGKADGTNVDLASLGSRGFLIRGANYDQIGWSASSAGDLDADGLGEVALGGLNVAHVVYGADGGGSNGAGATVELGVANRNWFRIQAANNLGRAVVSGVSDLNADAVPDVLVGFPSADSERGAAFALYSPQGDTPTIDLDGLGGHGGSRITGTAPGDRLGSSLAGVDVGPDGNPALLIGAPGATAAGQTNAGHVRMIASGSLAGSDHPDVGRASSSNSTGCRRAGSAKPFSGPKSLPACRRTARGSIDRAWRGQRSHYKMRRYMPSFATRQVIYDSYGARIAELRQVSMRYWEVFDQNGTQITPSGGIRGRFLIQGRACMRQSPPGGAPRGNYALVGLEPGKGGYRGPIDPWLRGFVDEAKIPEDKFFASNKGAQTSKTPTRHSAISKFRTGCGDTSYGSTEPHPVTKTESMFHPDNDRYVGYLTDTSFRYRPYSRPLLNSVVWNQNSGPQDDVLLLSAGTTGVRYGGIARAVIHVGAGAAGNARQVDHIKYRDNNVPSGAPVAQWCRVKAGNGSTALVGWYPKREPAACGT